MIALAYRPLYIIAFLIIASPIFAIQEIDSMKCSPLYEVNRKVELNQLIDGDALVKVDTRHGDVEIVTWGKNEIDIVIDIKATSNSKSAAQAKLESVDVEFNQANSQFELKASLRNVKKGLFDRILCNDAKLDIDYKVFLPRTINLNVVHNYGDVSISDLNNDLSAKLAYGNLNLANVYGNIELEVKHGNAYCTTAHNVHANVKHGSFEIKAAHDIYLDSKYSSVKIEQADNLYLTTGYDTYLIGEVNFIEHEGKYDNLTIESAGAIVHESKYSSLKVRDLNKSISCSGKHGSVKVLHTSPDLELAEVYGKYMDVRLKLDKDFRYHIKTNYVEPYLYKNCNNVTMEKDGAQSERKGYCGSRNAKTFVELDIKKGSIKID